MRPIAGRDKLRGREVVASISGGKDSAAMAVAFIQAEVDFRPVFLDTGWEHPKTYEYIRGELSDHIGQVEEVTASLPELPEELEEHAIRLEGMLGFRSAMVRLCLHKGMFPSRQRRWCTQILKVFAMRDYLKAQAPGLVNAVGIRRQESSSRAAAKVWEESQTYGTDIWRPLVTWSELDVIGAHRAAGLRPNPLYLRGSARVGCWPCIHARKSEIAALDGDPRVAVMEELERVVGDLAEQRSAAKGMTLAERGYHRPTWFQSRDDDRKTIPCPDCRPALLDDDGCFALGPDLTPACETCNGTGKVTTKGSPAVNWPIAKAIDWATDDDIPDTQELLFGGSEGCMRWGLCE